MKKSTVERMYSAKVAQLLNDGWHINTGTMPGHQGEIAHVGNWFYSTGFQDEKT